MRCARLVMACAALALFAAPHARTASPRDSLLVTPAWLATHLADPGLVLLHVSDEESYKAAHIPGARFVNYSRDLAARSAPTDKSLSLEMPGADALRERLAALGISDTSRIVVYFGKGWVTPAARVMFTLDYAGLGDRTSLMDGGTDAWVRDGHALSDAVAPPVQSGTLSPLRLKPVVVDAAFVNAHRQAVNFAVVDAREPVVYDGVAPRSPRATGPPGRQGHISGARNVPWNAVVDEKLNLRPASELEALFTKAGVKPGDTVIGYCYVGQIATEMLFAARTLGHPVLLYDGSWEEWEPRADLPVDYPSAAGLRDNMLVSPAWLAQHANDPDLVVLDVSDAAGYAKAHIPGARLVAGDDVSVSDHNPGGMMVEMPAPAALHDRLEALGISDRSRIVVYSAKQLTSATRVALTLDYAGLGRSTSVLDGGMDAWVRERHPVTTTVPPATKGTLAPLRINAIVVDAAFVKANLQTPTVVVIDARAASYYDGVQTNQTMAGVTRPGHIAGARSIPFTEMTDAQARLKSAAELAAIFTKAGVKPGDTVIGYCHVGIQATAMLFAARSLGHPILLYDGSFEDWAGRADYPVDNPAKKGGL